MRYFRGLFDTRAHAVRLAVGELIPARPTAICGALCRPDMEVGLTEAPKQVCKKCTAGRQAIEARERQE